MASAAERVAVLLLLGLASCDWFARSTAVEAEAAPEPGPAADGLGSFIETLAPKA